MNLKILFMIVLIIMKIRRVIIIVPNVIAYITIVVRMNMKNRKLIILFRCLWRNRRNGDVYMKMKLRVLGVKNVMKYFVINVMMNINNII